MDQTASSGIKTMAEVDGYTACCFAQVGNFLWVGCAKRDILVFDPSVCYKKTKKKKRKKEKEIKENKNNK